MSSENPKPSAGREIASEAASLAVEATKDAIGGLFSTALMYIGIFLTILLPIGALAVGVITLLLAIRAGRSKFMPILTIIGGVVFWILFKSPFGLLPAIFASI